MGKENFLNFCACNTCKVAFEKILSSHKSSHTVKFLQQSVSLLWVVFAEENSNQILKWINKIV